MKKNGFISTTLIYTFFIIFLLLMIFLLNNYSRVRYLLGEIKYDIKNSFSEISMADINLNIFVLNPTINDYELVKEMPEGGYLLNGDVSYCRNGGTISYVNDEIIIDAKERDYCYAYFTAYSRDVTINVYKETIAGTKYFNEKNYTKVDAIPGDTYEFNTYECTNGAKVEYKNRKFNIDTAGQAECNIYFNRIGELQELVFMQEADTCEDGYTIGKKYQRVASAPTTGYRYIGYKCDSAEATVTYVNGKFTIESEIETVCYAYFNKNTGGAQINYFIESIDGVYNSVIDAPTFGYTYNSAKSKCLNGGKITVDASNKVTVNSTDDVCDVYFDLRKRDVQLEIYVMNRETGKWEVGKVPKVGYEIYNAGCNPNNASIEYKNGKLEIESDGPTVCTVYFR